MSWSDTTPAPAVAGTPSYLAPVRRAEPNATSPEMPLWHLVLHMRSSSREETMVEQPVNLPTAIYLGVFSRAEQRVLASDLQGNRGRWRQMCRYPRNARPRLEHQQANHAQCDRPSGRNRPSRKDQAPLLLRCLASQHLKLRGALMVPHGAGVGVYVRGALSGFAACRRKAKHGDISHRPAIGRYHHQLSSIATRMTPPLPRRPANSLNKPTQF